MCDLKTLEKNAEELLASIRCQMELAAPPRVEWAPGGDYGIYGFGYIGTVNVSGYWDMGMVYGTREDATWALPYITRHNRLLAYLKEFAPDHDPSGPGCEIIKVGLEYRVATFHHPSLSGLTMPRQVAVDLVDKLSTGCVRL